ncbi:hypothetical protein LTS18_002440, partial [Coniosporium uncinatum]
AVNGIFASIPIGLGSAVVTDMFFKHERGLYMGLYSVTYLVGDHAAHIIGGYVATVESWRWCFFVPGFFTTILAFVFWFTVPETIYHRDALKFDPFALKQMDTESSVESAQYAKSTKSTVFVRNMFSIRFTPHPTQKLTWKHFLGPLKMLLHPSIVIPAIFYAAAASFGATLFVMTSAELFEESYHFDPDHTGLLLGIPLTVGSLLGELGGGRFSDWVSERRAYHRGRISLPEDRLLAIIPGAIFVPAGIIFEGFALQYHLPFTYTGMAIALSSIGVMITTTVVYAYTAEVQTAHSAD